MKAELVPLNGDPPIRILKDLTVVGRREFCDVTVDDPSLSKRHCVLVKTDGLLILRDLATTNGTKVNGQRVRWAALLPNDKVTLGGYKVRVYMGSDAAASPSETVAKRSESQQRVFDQPSVQDRVGFSEPSPLSVPVATFAPGTDDAPNASQLPIYNAEPAPLDSIEDLPWPKFADHEEFKLELDEEEPLALDASDLF